MRTSLFASSLVVLVAATQPACASSIVTEWLDQTIPAAKQTAWEPTVGARFFALVHAAMYDAWTAYDPVAVGIFAGTSLRGTGGRSTVENKREAVSHAAYDVRRELAPVRRRALAGEAPQLLSFDWHSDGSTACQIEFQASVASGAGRVTFKDIKSWRQWSVVEGVPRYREMSDLILSK